jgi:hypothetical protein
VRFLIGSGALAPPIAFVALSGFGDILGLRTPVGSKRAADVIHFLELPFGIAASVTLVAFMRLYQFAFRRHRFILH